MTRAQRLNGLAVTLWVAAILFLFLSGFTYNGWWLLSAIAAIGGAVSAWQAEA